MTAPQQMQSQALDYVTHGQQAALRPANTMTETWLGAAQSGGSSVHGGMLPRPTEFVDQMFDYWLQLLEAQRGFALSWVNAFAPTLPASGQVVSPTARKARVVVDVTPSEAVVSSAPSALSSTTAARTADSTADEHISAAAADAIATAADSTAKKTATSNKTTAPKKTPALKKTPAPSKASAPKKTSPARTTSPAKQKRS